MNNIKISRIKVIQFLNSSYDGPIYSDENCEVDLLSKSYENSAPVSLTGCFYLKKYPRVVFFDYYIKDKKLIFDQYSTSEKLEKELIERSVEIVKNIFKEVKTRNERQF